MSKRRVEVKLKRLKADDDNFISTKTSRKTTKINRKSTKTKRKGDSEDSSEEPEIEYPCDQCEFISSKSDHLKTHRVWLRIYKLQGSNIFKSRIIFLYIASV